MKHPTPTAEKVINLFYSDSIWFGMLLILSVPFLVLATLWDYIWGYIKEKL